MQCFWLVQKNSIFFPHKRDGLYLPLLLSYSAVFGLIREIMGIANVCNFKQRDFLPFIIGISLFSHSPILGGGTPNRIESIFFPISVVNAPSK